jgi:hypothetical protein
MRSPYDHDGVEFLAHGNGRDVPKAVIGKLFGDLVNGGEQHGRYASRQ